jgi:hypothetical protein
MGLRGRRLLARSATNMKFRSHLSNPGQESRRSRFASASPPGACRRCYQSSVSFVGAAQSVLKAKGTTGCGLAGRHCFSVLQFFSLGHCSLYFLRLLFTSTMNLTGIPVEVASRCLLPP